MDSRVSRCNNLIRKIQKGDEKALDILFIEFGLLFLNMAKKYLYDDKYAEDLLSEVFLDLIKSGAKSFDENKNGLNWFFVIIKRKAYQYNVRYNECVADLEELYNKKSLAEFINSANDFEKSLDNLVISDSIKKLTEYENLLLYYRYWENLTIREIAQKLNKPKSTIHYEIKEIIKKLKKTMDNE